MRKQLTVLQQQIIDTVKGYSYNAYEVCRILNGKQPRDFQNCFYRFESKCRGNRCRIERNGCQIRSSTVDGAMRVLWKRGLLNSISLRWFDGRPTGKNSYGICTDRFRFYYLEKKDLAAKLKADIRRVLEQPPNKKLEQQED